VFNEKQLPLFSSAMAGVSACAARGANYWRRFSAVARRLWDALAGANEKLEIYIFFFKVPIEPADLLF
jgi:hypothetical protein